MFHRLTYGCFRLATGLVSLLPITACFRLGGWLGCALFLLAPRYRRLVRHNIALALDLGPDSAEADRLARRHFIRLGSNLAASVRVTSMPEQAIVKRVEMAGLDHLRAAHLHNRGVVAAISHLSNWELLTHLPSLVPDGRPCGTLYQAVANPHLDAFIRRRRGLHGFKLFDRRQGFLRPAKLLRKNGILGILVDQHAGDHGTWLPFFNRLASTSTLAALLARRSGAVVLPVVVRTIGTARWEVRFHAPVDHTHNTSGTTDADDPLIDPPDSTVQLTARINQVFEDAIRRQPEDWFWVHARWKTPQPKFLFSGLARRKPVHLIPGQPLKPFEILVRSPNWLGDACMAAPVVEALASGRPDARVTVLTPANLAPLWRHLPAVAEVIALENKPSPHRVRRLLARHGRCFDVAILLPNSLRSALEVRTPLVHRRIGFPGHHRRRLLDQIIPEPGPADPRTPEPPLHHARRYLHLATSCGAAAPDNLNTPRQAHDPTASDRPGVIRVGIVAGAEYGPAKRWPVESFATAAGLLAGRTGRPVRFRLFGVKGERPLADDLVRRLDDLGLDHDDRVGRTSLEELMDELRACRVIISNDTGSMHLAAFLGVPTVGIFGSTEPSLTSPIGAPHVSVRHHVPCSPCFLRRCPIDFRCMHGVSPEQVAAAADGLLHPEPGAGA